MTNYLSLLLKVNIHPLFWLMIGISILTANFKGLFLLFFIVFVHEMGHAISAHFFSWKIQQISLLPFGGVLEVDEHGNRPLKEEIFVILAGPLQHIWLVAAAYLLESFSFMSKETFTLFLLQNIIIFCFNLLPIWPLDGGKLLFIIFSKYFSCLEAHRLTIQWSGVSLFVGICFVLFYAPSHFDLWVMASFLIYSILKEWKYRHYFIMRFLLERYYGRKRPIDKIKPIVVRRENPIYDTMLQFQRGVKHSIVIEKENKTMSTLDENELLHAFFAEKRTKSTIAELLYLY